MSDVSQILIRLERGDPLAAEELLPLVYAELRQLAARKLSQERAGQTLQPTALVHEAYLRLVGGSADQPWENRGHFFAAAAEAMRRILIDQARRKNSVKHGGGLVRRELADDAVAVDGDDRDELLALDDALNQLAQAEPQLARLVELRYFAGLTNDEAALAMGISPRTAKRDWAYARAWLRRQMDGAES